MVFVLVERGKGTQFPRFEPWWGGHEANLFANFAAPQVHGHYISVSLLNLVSFQKAEKCNPVYLIHATYEGTTT